MSNLTLTTAGVAQIAAKQAAGQPLLLRDVAFSPDLNAPDPAWTALPNEFPQKFPLTHVGKMPDEDAVLYSTTLDQTIGDFTISLIGYYDDSGILVLIDQIPPFDKRVTAPANVFRHNTVLDYESVLAAMPLNLPTAQFHPEPKSMQQVRAEMAVGLDVAITSSNTFLREVPRLDSRIERLEGRSIVLAESAELALEKIQENVDEITDLKTEIADHSNELKHQIQKVDVNSNILVGPTINFTGSLITVDVDSETIDFSIPENEKGILVKIDDEQNFSRLKQLHFVSDDYIQLNYANEQLTLELNPARLKGFGSLAITDAAGLTTLNADGLDTTLTINAGLGITLVADDVLNQLTISSEQLQGYKKLVINDTESTTTLSAEDSETLRLTAGSNVRLLTNAETQTITVNNESFGDVYLKALIPTNDTTLSAVDQKTLAFQESETVQITLVGYGDGEQALKFETSFPDEINKSFTISGGNLTVETDANKVGGSVYCETIVCKGEITGFSTVSDARLKSDLAPLENGLETIAGLQGYRFRWNDSMPSEKAGKEDIGLLAQEVEAVLPEAIHETDFLADDGLIKTIRYERLIPVLVEAIKELNNKVQSLEKRLGEGSE